MVGQVKTRRCTLNSIMRTREFRLGVEDFLAGRDLRDEREVVKVAKVERKSMNLDNVAWNYERGRHFAAALVGRGKDPKALDGVLVAALAPVGGVVARELQHVCGKMMDVKEIV